MKAFLKRKNIQFSVERYLITALNYMAMGLFSSLIIGLILKVIGQQLGIDGLVQIGIEAGKKEIYGAAIGVAVAYGLQSPPLVLFASVLTGAWGASFGGPAGAFMGAVFGAEFGKMISKETKLDIILTPMITIIAGVGAAQLIGPGIDASLRWFGDVIVQATELRPIMMGIAVATLMGLALTAPISSAAIAIMMDLHGLAAGAATVGCAAQMIGFAVISYRDNGIGGFLAQAVGTSMLQISNIIRNPIVLIPPTLAGAILGPLATTLFQMTNVKEGAGMGTSGFVGQVTTFQAMGFSGDVLLSILLLHFILPGVLAYLIYYPLRKRGFIKAGDLRLNN
ncbi:PTS transporter subunit IIC [Rubeoparvulum massiliense]|uniref:PTS transporter subunit IIC n=1 Tax=Rubeoparvulum massiliense TaxID=1631346 RepID=UPI00065E0963|nr:PTS sugar transporter subunit IIC [Rubeoparvulum massiliense]